MSEEHKDQHGESGGSHKKGHGGHGAHGGGGHEEHEGAPEWLISFADNVVLMMGFFVILLAMNMDKPTAGGIGGVSKFPSDSESPAMQDFAIAMRRAFNNPVDIDSRDPREAALVRRLKQKQRDGQSIKAGPDGNSHDHQSVRPSAFDSDGGFVTFTDMSSELSEEAVQALEIIAEPLRGSNWIVEVRGHVSSVEAMRDKPRAMQLGFDRALTTAGRLIGFGLRWEQIRVVSCADNERATPRPGDGEGHQNNQRAEVVQLPETVAPDPYARGAADGVEGR